MSSPCRILLESTRTPRMKLFWCVWAVSAVYLTGANSYRAPSPPFGSSNHPSNPDNNNNNRRLSWQPRGGSLKRKRRTVDRFRLRSSTLVNSGPFQGTRIGTTTALVRPPATQSKPLPPPRTKPATTTLRRTSSNAQYNLALFVSYFCTCIAQTLATLILPFMAHDLPLVSTTTSFVATTAAAATLAGGAGKLLNGFLCQAMGPHTSSWLYSLAVAVCWIGLATSTHGAHIPYLTAALEYFVSIQWVACSVLMAQRYTKNNTTNWKQFTHGMTLLSLASTTGVLAAKFGGALLLQCCHWRVVALLGGVLGSTVGCSVMKWGVQDTAASVSSSNLPEKPSVSIRQSLQSVCGRPFFWLAALSHSCISLARTSDRVLAVFLQDATGLSTAVCGVLTASVTLGFAHGLFQAKKFHQLPTLSAQLNTLRRNYSQAFLGMLGLAALPWILPSSPWLKAALSVLCCSTMASSLSFCFYQIPPTVAASFGKNRAVCISFLDAMGYFLSALVWAFTGRLVRAMGIQRGWSSAFGMVAGFFGLGGYLMLQLYPTLADNKNNLSRR